MKLGDKILLVIIIILIIGYVSYNYLKPNTSDKLTIVIKQNGIILKEIDLDNTTDFKETFEWQGHINTVLIKNNVISVIEADCKDQVCIKQGSISRSGESIICLPNRFVVEIKSSGENGVDYIIK